MIKIENKRLNMTTTYWYKVTADSLIWEISFDQNVF